jgi:hypothetical protein
MRDDPRWQQVVAFWKWCEAREDAPAQELFVRWQQYIAALGAIASDSDVSTDERSDALIILDDISADPEAQSTLESALLKLRDAIEEPGTPALVRQQAIEVRRRFWSS